MSEENKHEWNIYQKLAYVQRNLKVHKGQTNAFGNYKYRSLEDIQEAVKPLLDEVGVLLTIQDLIHFESGRHYVMAIAKFIDCKDGKDIRVDAFARESEQKKGMDASQVTGATSSYARKYALNGLFAIDDTKDADSQDNRSEGQNQQPKQPSKDRQAWVDVLKKEMNEYLQAGLFNTEEAQQINDALMAGENDDSAYSWVHSNFRGTGQERMKETKGKQ
jgi:hypothetical protein